MYLIEFEDNPLMGLWYSTLTFASGHIALYSISEIDYGGFVPLVGGAFILGLLWSVCCRFLKSIAIPAIAHVTVNFLAFTGLYVENGF